MHPHARRCHPPIPPPLSQPSHFHGIDQYKKHLQFQNILHKIKNIFNFLSLHWSLTLSCTALFVIIFYVSIGIKLLYNHKHINTSSVNEEDSEESQSSTDGFETSPQHYTIWIPETDEEEEEEEEEDEEEELQRALKDQLQLPSPIAFSSRHKSHGDQCPICLEVFSDGELCRLLPSCSHMFHVPCIDAWTWSPFDRTCPVCRAAF